MKFILERADALAAINRVAGVVARNSSVPILSNVLIETDGATIRIRGTDLDMEASTSCLAAIETSGSTTVDAGKLREIVNAASPGSQISFELGGDDSDPRMAVKSGRSRFRLPVLSPDIYPTIPDAEWQATFSIEAATLSDMLARTVFAAGTEMARPALIGVYLTITGEDLLAVGCSGRRFATVKTPAPDGARDMPSIIIPTKAAHQIIKLLGDIGTATVSVAANKWRVEINGATITGKVVDYPYLDYQRGIPDDVPNIALASRDALVGCVKRALIAGESDSVGVGIRLTFSSGLLTVTGRNPDEEASDEIEIEYDGPETVIGLTAAYVIDAVNNLAGDTVAIGFGDDLPVVVLSSPSDDSAVNTCAKRIVK